MRNRWKETTAVANRALQPVIDFCQANPGAKAKIQQEFEHVTGRPWARVNFLRWLWADETKRVEPSLGIGLLLLECGKKVMAKESKRKY